MIQAWAAAPEHGDAAGVLVGSLKAVRGAEKVWVRKLRSVPPSTPIANSLLACLTPWKGIVSCPQENAASARYAKTDSSWPCSSWRPTGNSEGRSTNSAWETRTRSTSKPRQPSAFGATRFEGLKWVV